MGLEDMLIVAYTEMGLTVDEFWNLSWYEWGLEVLKLKRRNEKDLQKWEGNTLVIRRFMTLFANANRDSKTQPFDDTDWGLPLSFDKPKEVVTRELTPEEIEKKFGKVLKK